MSTSTYRTTCRLCHSTNLTLALSLGSIPLGDSFITAHELANPQPGYPVEMMLCLDCGNVQLSNVVDPGEIYSNYSYVTSVSHGLVKHFEQYADDVFRKYAPPPGSLVVEIGSNEGAMLRSFKARGLRVVGVDPAKEIADRANADGIDTWPTYFSLGLSYQIESGKGKAHLIIANNVMANVDDMVDVAQGVKSLLAPDGVFVFETSYLLDVVERALLDTIFSEHVSYFSVKPLRAFFERHGLQMIDAERTAPKGGSLRCTVQHWGGPWPESENVNRLAKFESQFGLDRKLVYERLGLRLLALKAAMQSIVVQAHQQGKTVAAWGAADGGTTLIYYFGLGPYLKFLVDDNPAKIGTYSPGYHIPVLNNRALKTMTPDYMILLAWRYADEIVKAHPYYAKHGGKWVHPLPEVKVLP